ncbi:cholecystokinin receptor-like [Anneissia japonica]|uniref:cholecystokinin receptor-like n=1 Tax=Anneissia japonica TaxID=1529436 RepID=UPI001425B3B1|nr:cholecystokinin receptor-like [Anneissia japonica]
MEQHIQEKDVPFYVYSTTDTVIITVFMPIVFAIGVIGNFAVCAVFIRIKSMRTVTNHYLVNLALADLIFLVFAAPQIWVSYASGKIRHDFSHVGESFCKVSIFFSDACILVSACTIVLVTIERYFAICMPHRFKTISTRPRAVATCICIWIIIGIYKTPALYFSQLVQQELIWPNGSQYDDYPDQRETCLYCSPNNSTTCNRYTKSLATDNLLVLSVIPIISVLYTLINIQLHKLANTKIGASSHRMKTQVVRMLIVTISAFFICISPFRIMNLFETFNQELIYEKLQVASFMLWANIGRVLQYLNAAINPIIYNLMSARYRQAFKDCFLCRVNGPGMLSEVSGRNRNKYKVVSTNASMLTKNENGASTVG